MMQQQLSMLKQRSCRSVTIATSCSARVQQSVLARAASGCSAQTTSHVLHQRQSGCVGGMVSRLGRQQQHLPWPGTAACGCSDSVSKIHSSTVPRCQDVNLRGDGRRSGNARSTSSDSSSASTEPEHQQHQQQQQQHSGSSSSAGPRSSDLRDQQQETLTAYLNELSPEQQQATYTTEQFVRVIAGPGSGKTSVVAARVAHLIASGAAPESLLVITFTKKAAGELKQRLTELLGFKTACRVRPSTFHALCNNLLRLFKDYHGKPDFQVATPDATKDIVRGILEDKMLQASGMPKEGKPPKVPVSELNSVCSSISHMKNFCSDVPGCSGVELLEELQAAKGFTLKEPWLTSLADTYDSYMAAMAEDQLVDFDDLLHNALALVRDNPLVQNILHARWAHVLVDESRDTNPCQFELVRSLTSPASSLFMVGDPDQAIYGFRGAKASLLSLDFIKIYGPNALTLTLSDNYRSREPIVSTADTVRQVARAVTGSHFSVTSRSLKPCVKDDTVVLMKANSEPDEAAQVLLQLQEWQDAGYDWGDMAVLYRNRLHGCQVQNKLVAHGIPCHVEDMLNFYNALEVKVAMALLRCVVDPLRSGSDIKQRLIAKGVVPVPLMKGLGGTVFEKIIRAYADSQPTNSSTSTSNNQAWESGIGSCLLGDLPLEPSHAQALETLEQYLAADSVARSKVEVLQGLAPDEGATAEQSEKYVQQYLAAVAAMQSAVDALQGLAPPWQPPPGVKSLQKAQLAAIDRLRSLVVLVRAVAVVLGPGSVMEMSLEASGVMPALHKEELEAWGH